MAGVERICAGFISANKQNINKELGNKKTHTIYMQQQTSTDKKQGKPLQKISLFKRVISRALNRFKEQKTNERTKF